jgi:hypothetical protein
MSNLFPLYIENDTIDFINSNDQLPYGNEISLTSKNMNLGLSLNDILKIELNSLDNWQYSIL